MFDNIINLSYPNYRARLSHGYPKHSCILASVIQIIDAVSVSVIQRINVDIRYYKTNKNNKNIN